MCAYSISPLLFWHKKNFLEDEDTVMIVIIPSNIYMLTLPFILEYPKEFQNNIYIIHFASH